MHTWYAISGSYVLNLVSIFHWRSSTRTELRVLWGCLIKCILDVRIGKLVSTLRWTFSFKSQVIELTCQYSQMPVSCCDLLFLWLLYHDLNVDDGCLLPYFFLIEWKASGRSEPGLWQSRHWKCWQDLRPSSSQPIWRRVGESFSGSWRTNIYLGGLLEKVSTGMKL